jgi:hypothetical protein
MAEQLLVSQEELCYMVLVEKVNSMTSFLVTVDEIGERIILKITLKKYSLGVWTGFIWLMLETSSNLL